MTGFVTKKFWGVSAAVLLIVASSVFLLGTGYDQCPPRLARIDSLMDSNPQAAYDSLLHIDSLHIYKGDKAAEMRMRMLKVKAQNKLSMQLPSDSSFMEVVSYYDRHGSPNDRMLSHYLLGSIYRDMNEAPMALECFNNATEQADTTRSDCDYHTLFRIYGQMAHIYESQFLFDMAKKANVLFCKYALKAGDIYNYIRGKEFIGGYYFEMGDTTKAINISKDCIKLYNRHGLYNAAAAAYPIIIETYIRRAQYDSAYINMDIFENKSGLFIDGEIVPDRQHYYYSKGTYNLGVGKTDYAEYYFRKLVNSSFEYDAYKGLLSVFNRKMEVDSIRKYSVLCENAMDTILARSQAEAVIQASASYNYNRMRRIADESKLREQKTFYTLLLSGVVVFVLAVYAVWYIPNMRRKSLAEKEAMNQQYVLLNNELARTKANLKNIRSDKDAVIRSQEEKLTELQKKVTEFEEQYSMQKEDGAVFMQEYEDIVECFRQYAMPRISPSTPTAKEWQTLRKMVKNYFPRLNSLLLQNKNIGEQEFKVCILTYMGFKPSEITIILDASSQSVTNAKASVNDKLFGNKSAAHLYSNLINM